MEDYKSEEYVDMFSFAAVTNYLKSSGLKQSHIC